MNNSNADALLQVFKVTNVDLKKLNPNVVRAWFDTDCESTKEILNFLATSISTENYFNPLENTEYKKIEDFLEPQQCREEALKLNANYINIFDDYKTTRDVYFLESENGVLKSEIADLEELIQTYEKLNAETSSEVTALNNKKELIKIQCNQLQKDNEDLSDNLHQAKVRVKNDLLKFDDTSFIINFINLEMYNQNILELGLIVDTGLDAAKRQLTNCEYSPTDPLLICKRRIFESQKKYWFIRVEKAQQEKVLQFLNKYDENCRISHTSELQIIAREANKFELTKKLSNKCGIIADQLIYDANLKSLNKELENIRMDSQIYDKVMLNVTTILAYWILIKSLLTLESKDLVEINDLCERIKQDELKSFHQCNTRIDQMKAIIEEHEEYKRTHTWDQFPFIQSLVKFFSFGDKSVRPDLSRVNLEIASLENKLFNIKFNEHWEKFEIVGENIRNLEKFIASGPTSRVNVLPYKLQKVWTDLNKQLQKEDESINKLLETAKYLEKSKTKSQQRAIELLIAFLTNPSKVEFILKEAEEDFIHRSQQNF